MDELEKLRKHWQRMRKENLIELSEKGRYAKYIIKK